MENPYASPQGEIITPSYSFTPLTWKQILFSFQSRIPRRQYWGAHLVQILAVFVCALVIGLLVGALNSPVGLILIVPMYIGALWAGLAVAVKRCHDRDKSGWFLLVALIPIVGGIWLFIECGCLRGTEGPNRFGGDPT